jgi:hypothetical protein
MKIKQILGENGAMPQLCNRGACPAAIITEDGHAYVQGYELTSGEKSDLSAPQGEGFVKMPLATLRKIAAQVASGAGV